MIRRFGLVSDDTLDNTTVVASVTLSASIIERHFTLNRKGGGPDNSFSLEPREFLALCRDAQAAWDALGEVEYGKKIERARKCSVSTIAQFRERSRSWPAHYL
ncbi:N-acetylneuraminate synthase family protein [Haliea sp. E1-2-M8]|uniref:N-acetylneuraminate synthase family protein n=1 Tax=Haliea sp. E1-2-M8 TaxID=3064706 RepID=UPI00351C2CFC